MPLVNMDFPMIYKGGGELDAVYKGNTLIWENNPIIQDVITVTEGKNDKNNTWGFSISLFGSVSPTTYQGIPIRLANYSESIVPVFSFALNTAANLGISFFDRILFQGDKWRNSTDSNYEFGGTGNQWQWVEENKPSRWDGVGTSTVILEILP